MRLSLLPGESIWDVLITLHHYRLISEHAAGAENEEEELRDVALHRHRSVVQKT